MNPWRLLIIVSLVGAAVACGQVTSPTSQKATPLSGGNCRELGAIVSMSDYAGHTVPEVEAEAIIRGTAQFYVLGAGTAGHEHMFIVTAADFANLNNNIGVFVTTNADATKHTHTVVINCKAKYLGP